jgi:HAD superfamily hydrolase (TIGR01509 family)
MDLAKVKVCIFDVNGVLIESNLANARAMAKAFSDDTILQQRIAKLYLRLTGIDRGSKIRRIQEEVLKRPFGEKEFDLRWERVKNLSRLSMLEAPILPGSAEVLTELGKRNITRVVLSNTPLFELQEILAAHKLVSLLDLVEGGGDWPKAESLVRLIRQYRFDADRCLFVGDGKGDLAAAKYAGVAFVAIDPHTGEFDGEEGFDGPYRHLADWGKKVLGLDDWI